MESLKIKLDKITFEFQKCTANGDTYNDTTNKTHVRVVVSGFNYQNEQVSMNVFFEGHMLQEFSHAIRLLARSFPKPEKPHA